MTENTQLVFSSLKLDEETGIDEIIHASGAPSSAANVALFSLEMKRLVKQLPGKFFVRRR